MTERRIHLVSTLKNEGPYLLEWIAYHRAIGVTDFTLFSNDCTDGSNLMLNRLEEMGIIRHFDNPIGPGIDPQRRAYSRAGKLEEIRAADYVLIIDGDEFLNVRTGDRSINALIDACDEADAICVNWRLMGSCGEKHWRDDLVIERFTRGSSFEKPENGLVWGFKTLFKPQDVGWFGVHRPKYHKENMPTPDAVRWVNASGRPMGEKILRNGWRSNAENIGWDFAQVNHYAVKSREEFLLKRLRGTANSKNKGRIDLDYWGKYDINTNKDDSIPVSGVADGVAELLKDQDLKALYRACLLTCKKTIEYQKTDSKLANFIETGLLEKAE